MREDAGRSQDQSRMARRAGSTMSSILASEAAAGLQTFLAFDFGTQRTGVAVGNRLLRSTSPQSSIAESAAPKRLEQAAQRIKEWQPDALVVGVPFYPDGADHENTLRARKFARQLRAASRLPVFEVDERYSSTEAHSQGARNVDAAAAQIILEQFLRSLP